MSLIYVLQLNYKCRYARGKIYIYIFTSSLDDYMNTLSKLSIIIIISLNN